MAEETARSERRHFTRILFNAPVRIITNNKVWDGTLVDLSLKGALVRRPAGWSARDGERMQLEVPLDAQSVVIRMEIDQAHQESDRVGFMCKHIDIDSITHLRRLMELNMGDVELLNRELSGLG